MIKLRTFKSAWPCARTCRGIVAVAPYVMMITAPPAHVQGATFTSDPQKLWTDGDIPYRFADDFGGSKTAVRDAMDEWEKWASVNFEECPECCPDECNSDSEDPCEKAHILIVDGGSGNWSSSVGRPTNECRVVVTLNSDNVGSALHELGHAMGLYHEQQRADRNLFLEMQCDRILPWRMGDWQINPAAGYYPRLDFGYPLAYEYPSPFDFDSSQLYSPCTSSNCKVFLDDEGNQLFDEDCNGIDAVCPAGTGADCCTADPDDCYVYQVRAAYQADATIDTSGLSALEKLTMSFLYPQDGWRFVDLMHPLADCADDPAYCGTFLRPYREVTDAIADSPPGGTLKIQPAYYAATGVHDKAMILDAPLGRVILGDSSGPIQIVGPLPQDNCADLAAPKDCDNQIGQSVVDTLPDLTLQRGERP